MKSLLTDINSLTFKDRSFLKLFGLFVLLNILLYLFITLFYNRVPFNDYNYYNNAHHYFDDPRIENGNFNLIQSLGVWDAQWYLFIASEGYPKNPSTSTVGDKSIMDALSYAFFPLYPLILGGGIPLFMILNSQLLFSQISY